MELDWNKFEKETIENLQKDDVDLRINWFMLGHTKEISEKFYETYLLTDKFVDRLNWNALCHFCDFSQDFYERLILSKYKYKIDFNALVQNNNITTEFIEKKILFCLTEKDTNIWRCICFNKNLNDDFLKRNIQFIDWVNLCSNTSISESFFEYVLSSKFKDEIDWTILSENWGLKQSFFERHIDKVDWSRLCDQHFTESFFEEYIDKVNWVILCQNENMRESFFERHLDKVVWEDDGICSNPCISSEFFTKYAPWNKEVLKMY